MTTVAAARPFTSPRSIATKTVKLAVRAVALGATGHKLNRFCMYRDIGRTMQAHPVPASARVLALARSKDLVDAAGLAHTHYLDTDADTHDAMQLPEPDASFDVVLSDQLLEHVQNPQAVFDESFRVLKPGGLMIHTTCFMNPIHGGHGMKQYRQRGTDAQGVYHDAPFWDDVTPDWLRYTPDMLRYFARQFSIIACDGWGNRLAFAVPGLAHLPVPLATWHPLHKIAVHKESLVPMMVWIIAQKPVGQ